MSSGSNYLTTYYAKRIIGDVAAANATNALLQTGTNITGHIWIINRTDRLSSHYGIKYIYDSGPNTTHDKIGFIGGRTNDNEDVASAWVELDTGDVYILGHVGIGDTPEANGHQLYVYGTTKLLGNVGIGGSADLTNKLNVVGTSYFNGNVTHNGIVYFANGTTYYIDNSAETYLGETQVDYLTINNTHQTTYRLYVNGTSYFDDHITSNKSIWFGNNTNASGGKAILGYNSTYPNSGIWYFDETTDVMTLSASENADSKTDADFSINTHGAGTLANRNNRIPHTGNTTGTVGGGEQPVYVNAGTITNTTYALKATVNNGDANYVAYYSAERAISSSKAATTMIMPAHYYHNLYNNNPTTGTTVYVHYYNSSTTSTNTFANLRVKSGTSYKVLAFGGDGALTWGGTMTANGGYLKSTLNSNTVQIGSQNTGYCHITNSAAIPFWFNQNILMEKGKTIGDTGTYRPFKLYLGRNTTESSNALNAGNPLIEFSNSDRSQYCQLIYSDHDTLVAPDSLTLVGNQNGIFFICKNGPIWVQGGSNAGGNQNRLTTTSGMPGNMQYNVSRRGTQIYSNGIAFCDPYNGNSNSDAGWIRHQETSSNSGELEIAVGDDGDETVVVRQYNTSNGIKRTLTLLSKDGYTFIPSYLNIGGHEKNASSPTYVWGSNSSDNYLRSYQTSKLSVSYAASAGTSSSCSGNAASATYATDASNTQSIYGQKSFTVDGNANTYYPVLITGHTSHAAWTLLNISRGYSEPAPDTWNTSTHRGGLTLTILSNGDTAWGGNHALGTRKLNTIIDLSQDYCTMVGGIEDSVNGLIIWLRGGGARYWVTSNAGQSVSVSVKLSTYTASNNATYAARTTPNTTEIDNHRWTNLWTIANATTSASCSGNAATATNAGKWTTARNFTIKDSSSTNAGTAASVDGSGAVTLLLPATIKASITGNCSGSSGSCTGNAATADKLKTKRSLWGNDFDGSAAISGHITLAASKHIYMTYNSTTYAVLYTHNNGNVSLRACGGGLYIGYETTTLVNWLNGKMTLDSSGNLAATKFTGAVVGNVTGNCSGSSGSCTGNAATASKITNITSSDAASPSNTWRYAWFSYNDNTTGRPAYDTTYAYQSSTGMMKVGRISCWPSAGSNSYNEGIRIHAATNGWATLMLCDTNNTGDTGTAANSWGIFNNSGTLYITRNGSSSGTAMLYCNSSDNYFRVNTRMYGAVWNDYAEYRQAITTEGGRVVYDDNTGIMKITTERLQPAARIISDTYGFSVGESDTAHTPIGVSGRVLAYPYQNKENYKVGDAVCAAPNGTVDIMTREEIKEYPDRIIGIVSEIPHYPIWSNMLADGGRGKAEIEVKGRIWIYVK